MKNAKKNDISLNESLSESMCDSENSQPSKEH
jgi:hypothetical protein